MLLAPCREALVRRAYNLVGQIALFYRVPPIPVDAQCLKVDAPAIQFLNTFVIQRTAAGLPGEFRIRYDRFHFVDRRVRMDIDHAYPFTPDLHLAANDRPGARRYRTGAATATPLAAPALSICIFDAAGHR